MLERVKVVVRHVYLRTNASLQVVIDVPKEMKGLDLTLDNSVKVEENLKSDNLFPAAVKILRFEENIPNITGITDNIVSPDCRTNLC